MGVWVTVCYWRLFLVVERVFVANDFGPKHQSVDHKGDNGSPNAAERGEDSKSREDDGDDHDPAGSLEKAQGDENSQGKERE